MMTNHLINLKGNNPMRKTLQFFAFLGAIWATQAVANEPQNIAIIKKQLISYHDSGDYDHDIQTVMSKASSYLRERVEHNTTHQKLAIVLDIDETALSNYPSIKKLGFGGTSKDFKENELAANDPVIAPTLELYNYAKAHDVAVFFITGRKEDERAATAANLHKAGYDQWDQLILRDSEYAHKPAAVYKTAYRKSLTEKGYDIIENIGDQQSDLKGGYADKTYKLPNPYYYIP